MNRRDIGSSSDRDMKIVDSFESADIDSWFLLFVTVDRRRAVTVICPTSLKEFEVDNAGSEYVTRSFESVPTSFASLICRESIARVSLKIVSLH